MSNGAVAVPEMGRFLVYDGKIYRVKDMWLERSASDREAWTIIVWKEESR